MQQAQTHLNQAVRSIKSQQPIPENQTSEKKLYLVDGELLTLEELFWKRMTGLFGYAWTKQYGLVATTEWEMCLAVATPETIKMGIGRMKEDGSFTTFPPNPMQFEALCLPRGEDLGLPNFDDAFNQACGRNTEKHPAVIYAIRQLDDNFGFRQMKTEKAKSWFQEAWNKTLKFVMAGGKFPAKVIEIEEEEKPELSKEERQAQLAKIKQDLEL